MKPHVNNLITVYSHLSNRSEITSDVVKVELEWTNVCVRVCTVSLFVKWKQHFL